MRVAQEGTARRFAAGFGLGLLVLPLTALAATFFGGQLATGLVAFVALTAGAVSLPPVSGGRVAGVLTGIAAEVAAGVGVVAWYLMTHDITFG